MKFRIFIHNLRADIEVHNFEISIRSKSHLNDLKVSFFGISLMFKRLINVRIYLFI